ncbi:MAG: M24 family metallopeptidase [Deltaproteobacteria bacterium]|nr:MAG: M24 family metallopeptidase [Deltaproteobacteria bacterium]
MIQPDFAAHRAALLAALPKDEAVFLVGTPHHLRNGDAEYRYRPSSDIFWLTGWPDPEVAVLIRHGEAPVTLFVQEKDREREVWTGYRPGPEGAVEDYGADQAFEFADLPAKLPDLLLGIRAVHYAFAQDADMDELFMGCIGRARRKARKEGNLTPETFHDPSRLLHELRLVKTPDEIAMLEEAARITALAHTEAMRVAAPGVNEHEIDALIDYTFRRHGGKGAGYTNIVAGGANACILHYIVNDQPLHDGDLLLIDAGCEYGFYTADVTRTFPVSGRFTEAQREVYEWVLKAQYAAIEEARAGRPYPAMHEAACRVLTQALIALDVLEGPLDELVDEEAFKPWYMHGTGHWLGMDVHDVGAYARDGLPRMLAPGMVVTVEPGLYFAEDDEDVPERLRGIGIRIEDDILVTDGEPRNLTAAIPKTVAEVEAACGGAPSTAVA